MRIILWLVRCGSCETCHNFDLPGSPLIVPHQCNCVMGMSTLLAILSMHDWYQEIIWTRHVSSITHVTQHHWQLYSLRPEQKRVHLSHVEVALIVSIGKNSIFNSLYVAIVIHMQGRLCNSYNGDIVYRNVCSNRHAQKVPFSNLFSRS